MKKKDYLICLLIEILIVFYNIFLLFQLNRWNYYIILLYIIPFNIIVDPSHPMRVPSFLGISGGIVAFALLMLNSFKWILLLRLIKRKQRFITIIISIIVLISLFMTSLIQDFGS